MVKRLRRQVDCKSKIEDSLRTLGYDTNPVDQNQLHDKECIVRYIGVDLAVYTQEEYDYAVQIEIELHIDNNNELPYVIFELVNNVTYDVEQAVVPWSTSFKFTDCACTPLGYTTNVLLTAIYTPIMDWTDSA